MKAKRGNKKSAALKDLLQPACPAGTKEIEVLAGSHNFTKIEQLRLRRISF